MQKATAVSQVQVLCRLAALEEKVDQQAKALADLSPESPKARPKKAPTKESVSAKKKSSPKPKAKSKAPKRS